jgi:hypothetical protein
MLKAYWPSIGEVWCSVKLLKDLKGWQFVPWTSSLHYAKTRFLLLGQFMTRVLTCSYNGMWTLVIVIYKTIIIQIIQMIIWNHNYDYIIIGHFQKHDMCHNVTILDYPRYANLVS